MWSTRIFSRLSRKKVFDPETEAEGVKLDRCLTLFDLTALGIGSTLGVGIYVLAGSVAKDVAGPSVVLSFLIAGIASSLSGLCYAELGARVPKAGSAYVYSYVTVGEGIAFVIGWNLILEYAIGTASVARGYSGYIDSLMNKSMATAFRSILPIDVPFLSPYPDLCAFFITLLLTLVLCIGVKESTRFNNIFTCLNIFVVIFVTFCGFFKAKGSNWSLTPEDIPDNDKYGSGGFFPYGISGTLAGAATCFYGYVGFDTIATSGEEAQNPQKNIPLAIVFSLTFVFFAYFGIASALTLMLPYYLQDATAPLPHAFHETGWIFAGYVVTGGALFGLSTSLLGAMFPLPRVLYAMASDGLLFQWLSDIHTRYQTPFRATLVAGILAGFMAAMFELKNLVDMMSIGTLMAYTIVAVAVNVLRYALVSDSPGRSAQVSCCVKIQTNTNFRYKPNGGQFNGDYIALTSNQKLLCEDLEDDSEDEIVYCSDENPVLPTNDPIPVKSQPDLYKVLLCPWRHPDALDVTSQAANILSIVSSLTSFVLAVVLIHHPNLVVSLVLLSIIVMCTILTAFLPSANDKLSFQVPLVPFLPNLSIFINLYLMLKLSLATWCRFLIWMTLGFLIYVFYGCKHSTEEKRNRF